MVAQKLTGYINCYKQVRFLKAQKICQTIKGSRLFKTFLDFLYRVEVHYFHCKVAIVSNFLVPERASWEQPHTSASDGFLRVPENPPAPAVTILHGNASTALWLTLLILRPHSCALPIPGPQIKFSFVINKDRCFSSFRFVISIY